MKIFVNCHEILPDKSGVGWYAYGMVKAMSKSLAAKDTLRLITHPGSKADVSDLYNAKTVPSELDWIPSRGYGFLLHHNIMPPVDALFGKGFYFFPNFIRWPLLRSPSVIGVHDLSMYVCPQYLHPDNLAFMTKHLPASVAKATLIAAVSNSSRDYVIKHFKIDPAKVIVTYPALGNPGMYPRTVQDIAEAKATYGIFGNYLLFVSTLEPRKNVSGVIRAYRSLPPEMKKDFSLVLIGGRGWHDEEIRALIHEGRYAGDRIVLPGYVKNEHMGPLFSGATAFLYPSHYEGFGIPVLEAMAAGTPVITADNSSLPEVGGDAVLYVNSNNQPQFNDTLGELLSSTKLQKSLRTKGLKQAEKFTWEKSAKILMQAMRDTNLA
jgi:glycosyltransferase involved in cell wall biosynthesis